MNNQAPYTIQNTPKNNSLLLSWAITKNKTQEAYKSILNRHIFKAPKINTPAVVGNKAKRAAISIKAHRALNVDKGTKALYLLG
jgi:hypothetical protein